MCKFGHLHTHSEYSLLDGMGKIKELLDTAKSLGQTFISITDHGSTSGLYEAQKYGDEIGIKLIHGVEFYYEREGDGNNGHLLVLAKNNEGLRNIFRMQYISCFENFYKKPRINWDILKEHKEGLIVTSACLGSPFNQFIINGEVDKAREWAKKYQEVFGEDFYIEIQPNDIPEQLEANKWSIKIAKELGIELVATNDVHYVYETDDFPHEVLLAMQTKKKMHDERRFRFPTNSFWLKSEEEMYETFIGLDKEDVRTAIENTAKIAEKCSAKIERGNYLPKYHSVPKGKTERELLVEAVMQGAREKGLATNKEFMKEVQHEINVIDESGYSGYFLIVWDYCMNERKKGNLVGDGRGSGAGSKVAYLIGITDVPPHLYDLLFERFMAKGRTPDFDVDFSDQESVFNHLRENYGERNVARIITFGRMTPKAVARKVLNTFGHDMKEQAYVSKMIPEDAKTLQEVAEANPKFHELMETKYRTEYGVMKRLEGIISQEGKHAGGVVIYEDLPDYIPVKSVAGSRDVPVVAVDKNQVEELGFYKFDVLGLETLPVIYRALRTIKEETGKEIKLNELDYEDPNIYKMLSSGDVTGVFQLSAQAGKVMEQQPRNFRDLIAINALVRPGVGDWEEYIARRKGKSWSVYEPRRAYMEETEGTMTYQEQFLLDAHYLAGWDIAYADKHIRKNKDIRNDEELRTKFYNDVQKNGHTLTVAQEVWQEIEDAVDGGYSFNKSHSASYARISFQTAWLKYYYPEHFYASLMSGEKTDGDGQSAIAGYIAECKERGITILPPDINRSGIDFIPTADGINYRITTIKHVGESAINHIISLRPIQSFDDFMERRERKYIKQNVLVNLIKAGAFDFDNPNRAELLWKADMANRSNKEIKEGYECPKYEWNDNVKMEWEKEVLGMYLSTHPFEKYGFKPLDAYQEGERCIQGGEVKDVRAFYDRNKNQMAFVFLDTLFGDVKAVVFQGTWNNEELQQTLEVGNRVLVRGRRSGKDILVDSAEILE